MRLQKCYDAKCLLNNLPLTCNGKNADWQSSQHSTLRWFKKVEFVYCTPPPCKKACMRERKKGTVRVREIKRGTITVGERARGVVGVERERERERESY